MVPTKETGLGPEAERGQPPWCAGFDRRIGPQDRLGASAMTNPVMRLCALGDIAAERFEFSLEPRAAPRLSRHGDEAPTGRQRSQRLPQHITAFDRFRPVREW